MGGAERQMLQLIEGLVSRRVRCAVFVLNDEGPLRKPLDRLGVEVRSINLRPASSRLGKIAAIAGGVVRLWWTAVRLRPDAINAYLPLTSFMGAVAGRLALVPLVVTCRRALGTHQDRRPIWRLVDRVTNSLSHAVVANSLAVANDTVARDRIEPRKITVIRNGLVAAERPSPESLAAVRAELGVGPAEAAIVTVANLIPYKGHADLIDAMALLRSLPLKLFIVGRDDGIGKDLTQRIDRRGLGQRVVLLGERNDVDRILPAMDLFVLASHEEGCSNALIEAMAAGVPVVATDVGGNPEALEHGRFGTLVPPHDPVRLAEAIEAAATRRGQSRPHSIAAMTHVIEAFSATAMVDSYLRLFRSRLER